MFGTTRGDPWVNAADAKSEMPRNRVGQRHQLSNIDDVGAGRDRRERGTVGVGSDEMRETSGRDRQDLVNFFGLSQ